MNDLITKEHIFHHPIDKVWDAISKAEEISAWFIKADFKAEAGYKYTFKASEENGCAEITGVVKEANPYTLVYTWIVKKTSAETTVKWMLETVENGTKLYLEHSGIANYPDASAVSFFNSFDKGWSNCIVDLEGYLKEAVHAG
ncbi:SRPBCC domain-containing protein [Sungkyunkwania multivorans]|uniref:SRPBCC domain-containing protein n=1 Tax=Sungkyunkwania multivorans TaxID=1173618 RepID=A0ABW3CYV3_9FLAO